jgi:hypothetical protein
VTVREGALEARRPPLDGAEEREGEPDSPPIFRDGYVRTVSRLPVSRLREDPTEPESPVRAGGLFTIRAGEVPVRPEPDDPDELFSEIEREGKLRTREGETAPPDAGLTVPRSTVRREGDAPDTFARPSEEFDLRSCDDSRFPVEEKLWPTDLRPSRERACRAREAMPLSALSAGRRLGWALPSERLPS